jgi:PAS domain S-box-containing protein
MWCASTWILFNALEIASADFQTALFWTNAQIFAIAPIPLLWLYMALQFTGNERRLTCRHFITLSVVPVVCLIGLLTNDMHGLFMPSVWYETWGSIINVETERGVLLIAFYLHGYLVVIAGAYLLARRSYSVEGFRWQGSAVLLGVGLSVGAHVLDWTNVNPIQYVNLAPLGLSFAVPLFAFTLARTRRADILPIARGTIVHTMQDAVLVLDIENRIIDLNPAAEAMVGQPLARVMGKPLLEAWPESARQIEVLSSKKGEPTEVRFNRGNQIYVLDARRSELTDKSGRIISHVVVLRDTTKRAQVEEALRLSEEHFRALTENATDLVVIVDSDSSISYASPSIRRVFGFELDDLIGKCASDFLHPEDMVNVMMALASSVQNPGVADPILARFRGVDGNWRVLECVANNLLEHPSVRGIVVNARDVTERTVAEEKLRLSEVYFRALTENSTDITIITGIDGVIRYVSPSLERIFNRSRDQVIGHSTAEFMHPDDFNDMMSELANLFLETHASATTTARFHDSDGQWHILECTVSNLLDHPAIQGIVVNARDVTERENIAQALRESEERYRLHFENVQDVVYSFDSSFRVLTVSPSISKYLGMQPEQFVGKSFAELGLLPPEYLEKALVEASKVLAGGQIESTTYEFIVKDGSRIVAEVSSSPVFQNGKVISAINVARDITERVQADARIRASLAEKETLLKEIHHRVKNNMQIIASLLSLQAGTIENPLMRAQLEDSQNRIRSMALVHERLYRSPDLAIIDFEQYLHDLCGYLVQGYHAESKGIVLNVNVGSIRLDVDMAIPCGLIVNELVSNALKHAFPENMGGVIRVDARTEAYGAYVLTVQDNGIGTPDLFDVAHSKTLGLQLVASLARQLKGTLSLQSGNGTTIALTFLPHSAANHVPIPVNEQVF